MHNDEAAQHDLKAVLSLYWKSYGGWHGIVVSPFFWLSLILLAITSHFWLRDAWWDQAISVIPNVLGFTLGGFAVFLGFGDEKFKSLIAGEDKNAPDATSPYMDVSSAFLHFVLIQVAALVAAIMGKATNFNGPEVLDAATSIVASARWVGDMFGYWLFLYGICLAAAAAIAIFRVAFWFDGYTTANRGEE